MGMTANSTPSLIVADPRRASGSGKYVVLFFFSGFPALLYQIVWQRALFTIYGVNTESVTVIVTVFMLGLGLGSLAGGWLSKRPAIPLLGVFGAIELGIAFFGLISLRVFHAVAFFTASTSTLGSGLAIFALLIIPTVLMGSTLPLLAAHLVRKTGNVGESVGILYAVNTFGSATACFLAAYVLMRVFGESGCTLVAAIVNGSIAIAALTLQLLPARTKRDAILPALPEAAERTSPSTPLFLPRAGLLLSASVGFIALCYEIVWYRLYSLASGRSAACFAMLLGWYLAGVAYGSLTARDACRGKLRADLPKLLLAAGTVIICGNVAAFLVGPALGAALMRGVPLELLYPFVFVGSALMGAAFPLISHASIEPGDPDSGAKVSYLYLANIIGCASGSYLVGFIAMDQLSLRWISTALLSIGLALGSGVMLTAGWQIISARRYIGLAAAFLLLFASGALYSGLYERLLSKAKYVPEMRFQAISETRAGVVTVTSDGTVYGGGVYDGHISLDLVNDVNGIFRPFAVDALHPDPKEVLIIGLSMGSWAQVIANNPRVAKLTVVEIDPGYLKLIPRYPEVASLLHNPKVEIVIDDGRRWLVRNPERQFDMIVMNTSQHWIAHASNLLSVDFLRLIRPRLKPGGIHYYQTTFSTDALLTGVTVFPYGMRVGNLLAVSDSPMHFDKERWRAALSDFTIDGKPILDLHRPDHRAALEDVLKLGDTLLEAGAERGMRLESADSLRRRFKDAMLITDDNMRGEWTPPAWYAR